MAVPDYRSMATLAAKRYGIDPAIFLRQIGQESGFDPNARSSAGALGIAQFMPATARGFHINPLDPAQALNAAALMDSRNIAKYGWAGALSAYNSGRADAYKDPNFAGGQTYRYVRSILGGNAPPETAGGSSVPGGAPPPARTTTVASLGQGINPAVQYMLAQQQASRLTGMDRWQALGAAQLSYLIANKQAHNPGTGPVGAPTPSPTPSADATPSATGLNPDFSRQLSLLEHAVPGLAVSSGFRTVGEQAALWQKALAKYGSAAAARAWVAPPGHSMHNKGLAADLAGNLALAHQKARQFGLYFPLSNEPWHIQPIGT